MTIVLSILLVLSIAINFLFGWYAFKLVKRFVLVQETFQIFDSQMSEFSEHLSKIYELEMFYGEPTLEALIQHTKFITEAYSDLRQDYMLVSGELDAKTEEESGPEPKQFEFKPINRKLA
jgi:hypothetical protein